MELFLKRFGWLLGPAIAATIVTIALLHTPAKGDTAVPTSESSLWETDEGKTPDGYFFERRETLMSDEQSGNKYWTEEIILESKERAEYAKIAEISPGEYSFERYMVIIQCQYPATSGPSLGCKAGVMNASSHEWLPYNGQWQVYHIKSSDKEHVLSAQDMNHWVAVREAILEELAAR